MGAVELIVLQFPPVQLSIGCFEVQLSSPLQATASAEERKKILWFMA
jgi:hypothetical protein